MEKLRKYLMLMLVATFSLTFTSCGGDDDEPEKPGGGTSPTKFEVQQFTCDKIFCLAPYFIDVNGDRYKFCEVLSKCDYYTNNNYIIGYYGEYYSFARNVRMAQCNKVSSLSQITSIKDLNWIDYQLGYGGNGYNVYTVNIDCFNLKENSGFILEGTFGGRTYYIRIYISTFNRNSAGEIIGVNGSFQQFIPQ